MNGCLDSGADGARAAWMSADIRAESDGGYSWRDERDELRWPNRRPVSDVYRITADDATIGIPVDVDSAVVPTRYRWCSVFVIAVCTPPISDVLRPNHAAGRPTSAGLVPTTVSQAQVLTYIPRPRVPRRNG
jgi:hypothetical protein